MEGGVRVEWRELVVDVALTRNGVRRQRKAVPIVGAILGGIREDGLRIKCDRLCVRARRSLLDCRKAIEIPQAGDPLAVGVGDATAGGHGRCETIFTLLFDVLETLQCQESREGVVAPLRLELLLGR
jgi:hypothetical protein